MMNTLQITVNVNSQRASMVGNIEGFDKEVIRVTESGTLSKVLTSARYYAEQFPFIQFKSSVVA